MSQHWGAEPRYNVPGRPEGPAIEHPDHRPTPGRWCVFVTSDGVRGCTGSYRWKWRARFEAHGKLRFWPGRKHVEIQWVDS